MGTWQPNSTEKRNDFGLRKELSCGRNQNQLGLGRLPVVVLQDAAQMLATSHVTHLETHFLPRLDQPIVQALVVSLSVIMVDVDVGMDSPGQHVLAKEIIRSRHSSRRLFQNRTAKAEK